MVDLLRSDPKTYLDDEAAAAKHEAALIRFDYLARKEFRLANPLGSDAAIARFLKRATERFPNRDEWSAVFSTKGNSVTITTRKEQMPAWEKFITDFDTIKKAQRNSKCKRRWRPLDPVSVRWFH